eukprot:m.311460 g.311460  ORF g.311460 m.311460 type:complete len:118 (+) comp27741_c0_seq1:717-1070(+)
MTASFLMTCIAPSLQGLLRKWLIGETEEICAKLRRTRKGDLLPSVSSGKVLHNAARLMKEFGLQELYKQYSSSASAVDTEVVERARNRAGKRGKDFFLWSPRQSEGAVWVTQTHLHD